MTKVRTLTIEGMEYDVDNARGIVGIGKFGGMMPHAVRDYGRQDESFGDCDSWGSYWWRVGPRAYYETSDGFVYEVSIGQYEQEECAYNQAAAEEEEREQAIRDAQDELESLLEEFDEENHCPQCEAMMINGVYCHETGCPHDSAIRRVRERIAALEDY